MFPYEPVKKILLVEPPFYRLFGYKRWHYPVTLTLVGTYLKKLGHQVSIYDADKPSAECRSLGRNEVRENYHFYEEALHAPEHPVWGEVQQTIEAYQPDIIGVTSITAKIDAAQKVADIARKTLRQVRLVLGGPHVQGMLSMSPGYDFGPAWDEVVPNIPGLVDQKPDKQLLMNSQSYSPVDLAALMTSSGCPNECTFCCHSFEKKLHYRALDNLQAELQEIKDRAEDKPSLYIMDDCFLSHTRRFREITQIIQEMGMKFTAGSRIMALTPEKIERFLNSGGLQIHVGVESGSQRVLDRVKKNLDIAEVVKRTQWLNDAGIPWSAFIIVGFPFETVDDLQLTRDLVHTIRPTFVSINRFTPYPGTDLYKEFFLNTPLRFIDLFQLNSGSCVKLPEANEQLINELFVEFDSYNQANRARNQVLATRA